MPQDNISLSKAILADIPGIMALQQKYLVTNLSAAEKKDGFVTTPFTEQQVQEMIGGNGLFVAKYFNKIIAYIFAGSWAFYSQWPIFNFMTARFTGIHFNGLPLTTNNSFQYGPICIDEAFRGQGLINPLFELMRVNLKDHYPNAGTFINKINTRSLKAHVDKLNWIIIDEFEYNNNHYHTLAFDMNQTVVK